MQKSKHFIVSVLILGVYLLSACSGAAPVPSVVDNSQNGQLQEIVFTGAVESMGDGQWTISGQQVSVDASAFGDVNIKVGDIVRVEASVSPDGSVVAVKIESSGADDVNANSNSNDANANDANTNTGNDNSNGNSNANSNDAPAGPGQEIVGVVEAITTDSITIDGVVYKLANFTEFKGLVAVGSQVKIHVIVNADGTFTIREIEQAAGAGIGGDNGNDNSNGGNGNLNGNDNGANANGNDNSNGNDSNSNDDNGSDSNSNDDNGNDSDSNSNNND